MKKIKFALLFSLCLATSRNVESGFRFGTGKAVAQRSSETIKKIKTPTSTDVVPTLALPFSPSNIVLTGQIFWPFGVQAGSHPNGHPGFDFDLNLNSPILASADGVVESAVNEVVLRHGNYVTIYNPLSQVLVSKGQTVTQGQQIGVVGVSISTTTIGNIHFELDKGEPPAGTKGTALCPYEHMTSSAAALVKQWHAMANYSEKAQFPLICNPCPTGGCR